MIEELGNFGIIGGYKFDICQAHAAEKEGKSQFNWTRAKDEILEDDTEQATKKPKRNAKPPSLGKRGASSPRQSPASKRRKNVAIEKPQQG